MSLQRKLLAILALSIVVCVALVAGAVWVFARKALLHSNDERVAALVSQFHGEFERSQREVVREVDAIANSDRAARMATDLNRSAELSDFVREAEPLAQQHHLDFLELLDANGTILSSAQWPAKFGYKESQVSSVPAPQDAFLKIEELPDGQTLGIFCERVVQIGEKPLHILGGRKLDRGFLATLSLPVGMRAMLYTKPGKELTPQSVVDAAGPVPSVQKLLPLAAEIEKFGQERSATVQWSNDASDSELVSGFPLKGRNNELLGVLLVGSSRRALLDLERQIRSAGLAVAGGGFVFAILLSAWVAARVTRPVQEMAAAAREVAAGNWYAQAPVHSQDELGELANSFNNMTRELMEQRDKLVQTERVAAWRELGRRLAHELKNPLFPLQITVENMMRAKESTPEQFEETFREGTSTLLAELTNLKNIIGRFSEFARMPQPQLQSVQINDVVKGVDRLLQAQLQANAGAPIRMELQLDESLPTIDADQDLLHRALSNLALNAMDAMPEGGTLTIRTFARDGRMCVDLADTGKGLTREECDRLFTPYYTSKRHGTGLGLAIVQSVISDHGGRISVESEPGKGTTFHIELLKHPPPNAPKRK